MNANTTTSKVTPIVRPLEHYTVSGTSECSACGRAVSVQLRIQNGIIVEAGGTVESCGYSRECMSVDRRAVVPYEAAGGAHLAAVYRDAKTGWRFVVEAPLAEFSAYVDAATTQSSIIALVVTLAILAAMSVCRFPVDKVTAEHRWK